MRIRQPHTGGERVEESGRAPANKIAERPSYSTYIVRKGDTLSGIAKRHRGVSVKKLQMDNDMRNSRLRVGQRLKIYHASG